MTKNVMPMAWNEPGSGDKNKNPWGKKPDENAGPPDLEEIFVNFGKKIRGLFGKGGSSGGATPTSPKLPDANLQFWFGMLAALLIALYLMLGFYTVASYEQGVITRFGKYDRIVGSGLHWLPMFVDKAQKVNTENLKSSRHSGWMLTKDENIILVEIEVQYRIIDPVKYLFNVVMPDGVLSQAADSAIRQVIGDSNTDDVLTNKKQQIAEAIQEQLIDILAMYDMGFHIEAVNFRDSRPPDDVKDAFDDVTKSREDRERFKHEAEAYANTVLPEAEGAAKKIIAEAEAYKERVILDAIGEAQRFNLILPGYLRAPQVTKTRMYMDSMEQVLSNTTKVVVSGNAGNNMIYLPLDKIMQQNSNQKATADAPVVESKNTTTPVVNKREKNQ